MASTVSGPPQPGQAGRGAGGGPRPGKRKRRGTGRGGGAGAPGLLLKLRWKAVFFALAALIIVGVMAWGLLGSQLLVVRSVQVAGNGKAGSVRHGLAAAPVRPGPPL